MKKYRSAPLRQVHSPILNVERQHNDDVEADAVAMLEGEGRVAAAREFLLRKGLFKH